MVPVQLRVGGAFMGIALVLVLYAVLALLRGDAAFPVTCLLYTSPSPRD